MKWKWCLLLLLFGSVSAETLVEGELLYWRVNTVCQVIGYRRAGGIVTPGVETPGAVMPGQHLGYRVGLGHALSDLGELRLVYTRYHSDDRATLERGDANAIIQPFNSLSTDATEVQGRARFSYSAVNLELMHALLAGCETEVHGSLGVRWVALSQRLNGIYCYPEGVPPNLTFLKRSFYQKGRTWGVGPRTQIATLTRVQG